MLSIIADVLIIACPVLIIAGIFFRNSGSYKNTALGKKLIIGGIASFLFGMAIGLIFDWDSLVQAFYEGKKAGSSNSF